MDDPVDPAALTWAAKFSNVPAADPGAAGDPNAGQAPAGDPPTAPPPTADPQTAPAPGDPSAPLAAPVATGAGGGTDPGATGDPNPPPATGQSDPPATTDAPKKINVTIVTSYGQNVRYWIRIARPTRTTRRRRVRARS